MKKISWNSIVGGGFVRGEDNRLQPIWDECDKLAANDAQLQRQMENQDEVERLKICFFHLLERLAAKEEEIRQQVTETVQAKQLLEQATDVQKESEALEAEVSHILDIVSAVEEGNLTVQARVSDKVTGLVADSVNRVIEELTEIVARVLKTAREIANKAINLSQSAEKMANGAQQQVREVAQVLTKTSQVEKSARAALEQVQASNQSLLSASQAMQQGQQEQADSLQKIEILQQGSSRIVQQMKTLGEFVGLADRFVQEQSDIAQQTQVLALNASLVAARAAGQRNPKAFSLVAREFDEIAEQIGKLAEQTDVGLTALEQRTSQIQTVVSAIDTEVQNLGGLMGEFTQSVQASGELFNTVQTVTAESILSGEAVARFSEEIVGATVAAATAMREIANLAQQTAVQTNSSLLESEAMGELSAQLIQRLEFFRLPVTALPENSPTGWALPTHQ